MTFLNLVIINTVGFRMELTGIMKTVVQKNNSFGVLTFNIAIR